MIRHVTFDHRAVIFEVTDLFTIHGERTDELSEAVTCVIAHADQTTAAEIAALPFPVFIVH